MKPQKAYAIIDTKGKIYWQNAFGFAVYKSRKEAKQYHLKGEKIIQVIIKEIKKI